MTENVTSELIIHEDEYLYYMDDMHPYIQYMYAFFAYIDIKREIERVYYPVLIGIGIPCNILTLAILIRHRLWLRHSAYIYLAAILIVDSVKLAFDFGDRLLILCGHEFLRFSVTSDVSCRFSKWLVQATTYSDWLYVFMLLNVVLHRREAESSNRCTGCCVTTNPSAKYCTPYGTKVVVASFFTACSVGNFWSFSLARLTNYGPQFLFCEVPDDYDGQYVTLSSASRFMEVVSLLLMTSLLILVAWKRWRNSGLQVFTQMNDGSQDNGDDDAAAIARIVIGCSVVVVVLRTPLILNVVYHRLTVNPDFSQEVHHVVDALQMISFACTISTPIVCLAVKSRFRDDLKAIVKGCCCCRCCPRSRRRGTVLPEPDNDGNSSVLQMDPIDEGSPVTQRNENSEPIIHQI